VTLRCLLTLNLDAQSEPEMLAFLLTSTEYDSTFVQEVPLKSRSSRNLNDIFFFIKKFLLLVTGLMAQCFSAIKVYVHHSLILKDTKYSLPTYGSGG